MKANGQSQVSFAQEQKSQQISYSSNVNHSSSSQSKQVVERMEQKQMISKQFSSHEQDNEIVDEI